MGNVLERANKNCKERWKLQDMGLENTESGKTERKESDNSGQIRDVKMGCGYRKKRAVPLYENIILCSRPGVFKCELGTDVRPEVSNTTL